MAVGRVKLPIAGVDLYADPTALPEGKWQRLKNLTPRKSGIVGQRPALRYASTVKPNWWNWDARALAGSLGVASAIPGYWRWARDYRPVKFFFDPNFGGLTMILVTTTDVTVMDARAPDSSLASVPAGTMLLVMAPGMVTGSGGEPILRAGILGPATRDPSLFSFNGITYAFAGQNSGYYIDQSPTSYSVPLLYDYFKVNWGETAGTFEPDGAAVVRDRVVYYKGPNVYWSDKNDPLRLGLQGSDIVGTWGLNISGEEQEGITAVAELSTSADGSPVQSVAAVWTKNRCFFLLGEPLETDAAAGENLFGSMQINRLNIECGCVSQSSVCRTPYGTFWVGLDDVWFMPFGQLPIRVGTGIRPALEAQPAGLRWRISSEYYDGSLRVNMFAPGQGPRSFDPCQHQWWLDLRNGPPSGAADARWFGPQEFTQTDAPDWYLSSQTAKPGVWCMARDQRVTGDGKLYALQNFTTIDGVYGMSLCGMETYEGQDITAPSDPRSFWSPGSVYQVGDEVQVFKAGALDPVTCPGFVCTTAGLSNSTEPNWSVNASGEVTDGTVVWTAKYFDGTNSLSARVTPTQVPESSIEWSMLGPEIFGGDEMVEKLLDGGELGCALPDSSQVTYNFHPDQAERSRIVTPVFDVGANSVNELGNWTGTRVWQSRQLTPDPNSRFHALSATFECKQDAGIVIVAGVNDTLSFSLTDLASSHSATIAAGYYEDIIAVVEALKTAMAADCGAAITASTDGGYGYSQFWLSANSHALSIDPESKLAQLLGYDPFQLIAAAAPPSTGSLGGYAVAWDGPKTSHAPEMQISGVNLRLKAFGRRPT